ncbi:copper amine oxidase N-terminal domain-containing protein, partial [Priestia megaterium]
KHARGTFEHGDRTITLPAPLGGSASRIVLGDQTYDSYQKGYDVLSGFEQTNSGNYGVNYKLVLERVQPNTLIALNARGGHYGGAFLVNGKLTYMTNENILTNSGEAGVLYRTGNAEEKVTIIFSPASGSYLPIHLMFIPLP